MSLAVAPILGVGATSAFASGANLLINGDFESGAHTNETVQVISPSSNAIGGWAVTSGSVDWIESSIWAAQSGTYSLDMNGNNPGAITQSFATVSGATYSVQFYMGANPGAYSSVTLTASVTGGSSIPFTVSVHPSVTWASESFTFTAISTTTTLTFAGDPNTGASGPALDNVSVTEVAPTIASAAITGTAQVGSTLTAVPGTITGSGTTTSYQWQSAATANGTYGNIGSNASTYTLVAGDAARFINVIITVTNNGGTQSQTSAATTLVLNGENCKKEGWQVMINSVTNKPFRNQGACVSYFATRGQVPIGS